MTTHTLISLQAQWFDGQSARRTPVQLRVAGDHVEVLVEAPAATTESYAEQVPVSDRQDASIAPPLATPMDVAQTGLRTLARAPLAQIQVSERVGNTPYRLSFPDGALAVTSDHAAVESAFALAPGAHWLARMERASWFVVLAIVGLGVALYFAWRTLTPEVAEAIAHRIPREAEKSLGAIALQGLDRWMLKTSRLEADELATVRKVFDELAEKAGLADVVELQFRDTVPNALALPGGTIVVTDGLVKLFGTDERLLAGVIAHELGHIHHRHSLRHLLEGSASAMIVGALVGDVSGVSALTVNAPVVLSTLHYTRESERESDQYAFDLLRKSGRSPKDFADAMRRFEAMELCMALRQKSRDEALKTAGPGVDRRSEEAAKERIADSCFEHPERAFEGRESDVAELRNQERETGYMHTHPITRERIEAAEAAARQ